MTAIEWTDETWNVSVGCSRVSAGCEHCYAERFASRGVATSHRGLTVTTQKGPRWTGEVRLFPDRLDQPLRWRKPRRIFIDSMSDLFHENVPFEFIDRVFAVMALASKHTFQVLTKRPERMRRYLADPVEGVCWGSSELPSRRDCAVWCAARRQLQGTGKDIYREIQIPQGGIGPKGVGIRDWPLPNVWLGTSVENQETAEERIPHLLATPAAVRFVSAEPLLGPVDIIAAEACAPPCGPPIMHVDWTIVGGESGPGARPCGVEWIRSIKDQCQAASVPCFIKQVGSRPFVHGFEAEQGWGEYVRFEEHVPQGEPCEVRTVNRKGADMDEWPEDLRIREMPS